jgi:hypothetical protein
VRTFKCATARKNHLKNRAFFTNLSFYLFYLRAIHDFMKNLTIIHILLFIILMIAYTCSSAQDYVVTVTGDTLKGNVKPLHFGPEQKVQVTDGKKNKTILTIFKTRSYSYHGEIFQPVRGEKGYAFMKLMKPGYLSLYAVQSENQSVYDGRYLVLKDGRTLEVPNLNFKKMMGKFLSDCSSTTDGIMSGTFGRQNLDALIDDYNQCMSKKGIASAPAKAAPVVEKTATEKPTPALTLLEDKIKTHEEFDGKKDALDMVAEIKSKIQRGEKIPNFLIGGLKSTLAPTDLNEDMSTALAEINQP